MDHARGHHLHSAELGGIERPFAVKGITYRIDHTPKDRFTHGNFRNTPRSLDGVSFLDLGIVAHNGDTNIILLQIEAEAVDSTGELQHLHGHGLLNAIDASDPVTNGKHGSGFAHFHLFLIIFDLAPDNLTYFFCSNLHRFCSPLIEKIL